METETWNNEDIIQKTIDKEHLRLLGLAHYISGGLAIAFSSLFIIQLTFMSFIFSNPEFAPHVHNGGAGPDPTQFMWGFIGMFSLIVLFGICFGIAQIVSGKFIRQRKYKLFSFIFAIPNIIFIPYGTLLAVGTIMVLERESVKKMYQQSAANPELD